jgi:hypothetical protein
VLEAGSNLCDARNSASEAGLSLLEMRTNSYNEKNSTIEQEVLRVRSICSGLRTQLSEVDQIQRSE